MDKKKDYVWHKQSLSPDLQIIDCPAYDAIKDFHRDPAGVYVLVRCLPPVIEVAVCNKRHVITHVFRGRSAQELYDTIFKYEQKHQLKWFGRKDHIAYLGKELNKAQRALEEKGEYIQE